MSKKLLERKLPFHEYSSNYSFHKEKKTREDASKLTSNFSKNYKLYHFCTESPKTSLSTFAKVVVNNCIALIFYLACQREDYAI
jgi:hypothetical protein